MELLTPRGPGELGARPDRGSSSSPPPHRWGPGRRGAQECGGLARLCPAEQEAGMSWGDRAGDKRAKVLPASCLPVPGEQRGPGGRAGWAGAGGSARRLMGLGWCVCVGGNDAASISLLPTPPSLAVGRARALSSERAWQGHRGPLALGWARCLPGPRWVYPPIPRAFQAVSHPLAPRPPFH